MDERFSRSALLLGDTGMNRLQKSRVAVFGVGGVGGHAAEALARAGVGKIDLIDADTVSVSNLNRQIVALDSTVGRPKVDVMKERILDINPKCEVCTFEMFYEEDTADKLDVSQYTYIIDAIDTVKSKLLLIEKAKAAGVNIISSMGAGNKLDPTAFEVNDIYKTSVCPLARVMRSELRRRKIDSLKVVYSKEEPICAVAEDGNKSRHAPGSVSFVPSVVGLIIGGEVIKDIALKNI
ncbi:MAG: tRNA threonylcarbamoyladenosine dehydratase [Ruminococcaceae bacterium]|nr:tRNA threonylcarbamoyladenosine dehydratase [Oscillospiraceae bacterium]